MNEEANPNNTLCGAFDAPRALINAREKYGECYVVALTKLDECGLWLSAAKDNER
jgi:hypothetical protein